MKVEDALYHAVHDYEGGVDALAVRMGELSALTLYSMANPRDESHDWSLRRFRQALAMTGDKRPLHALCEENGGVFLPVATSGADLPEALRQVATLAAEFGDVARAAQDALRDGRVSQRELANIETQVFELIAAAAALGQRFRADAERKPNLKVAG